LLKTGNANLESSALREKKIAKIVFKEVKNSMNQEVAKVLGELKKQLTAILGGFDLKDLVPQTQRPYGCPTEGISTRIKSELRQLFVYLQRVLMINVTQDLCKRLTKTFDELIKTVTRSSIEMKQLEDKIADYEKRILDLSKKSSEDHLALAKSGEDQFGPNDSFEKLSEHIDRLFELTHNATDLLEYASEKFSGISEQNMKLKGVHENGKE